jgi:hypothetical protein
VTCYSFELYNNFHDPLAIRFDNKAVHNLTCRRGGLIKHCRLVMP